MYVKAYIINFMKGANASALNINILWKKSYKHSAPIWAATNL